MPLPYVTIAANTEECSQYTQTCGGMQPTLAKTKGNAANTGKPKGECSQYGYIWKGILQQNQPLY